MPVLLGCQRWVCDLFLWGRGSFSKQDKTRQTFIGIMAAKKLDW